MLRFAMVSFSCPNPNFFAIPAKDVNYDVLDNYIKICSSNTFDGGRHQIRIQELEK